MIGENIFVHGSSSESSPETENFGKRDMMALTSTNLPNLQFVARGKVRDIYSFPEDDKALLFVATDRVLPLFPRSIHPSVPDPLLPNRRSQS